jgi:hypothetical protein
MRYIARVATVTVWLFTLVALAVPATASEASPPPTWHISDLVGSKAALIMLDNVAAVRGDAWAADSGGTNSLRPEIENWNGKKWIDRTPARLYGNVYAIGMTGPRNVWAAVGSSVSYGLRWNGLAWKSYSLHGFITPTGIAVLSSADVWVLGFNDDTEQATASQFEGHGFHNVPIPITPLSVSAVSAHDIWAVGAVGTSYFKNQADFPSELANWSGQRWRTVSLPDLHLSRKLTFQPMGITTAGSKNVWVDGNVDVSTDLGVVRSVLLHWNGKRWRIYTSPVKALEKVAPDGRGGVWLTANPDIGGRADLVHFLNGHWSVTAAPAPAGSSTINAYLVGIANAPGTTQEWAGGWAILEDGAGYGLVDAFGP